MRGDYRAVLPMVADRLGDALTAAFQATATEAAIRIIDRTPVKTGKARANTQLVINTASMDIIDAVDPDGGSAKSAAASEALSLEVGNSAVIGNPLEYVEGLENGTSTQAPEGMYGITEQEIPTIWARELVGAYERG